MIHDDGKKGEWGDIAASSAIEMRANLHSKFELQTSSSSDLATTSIGRSVAECDRVAPEATMMDELTAEWDGGER